MTNTNNSNVNWKQAASEAFLLLIGVLLALGGQAWWEDRVEGRTVSEYGNNLLLEIRQTQNGVQRIIKKHDEFIASGAAVLHGLQDSHSAESLMLMGKHVSRLGFYSEFRPATSALNNLFGAGGLGLIESKERQLAISRYAQSIEDHNVLQAELVKFNLLSFVPFLSDRIPLLEINFIAGSDAPDLPSESKFELDLTSLTESLEFENLVVRRVSAELDAKIFAQRLLDSIDELAPLLESND